jgi:lipopolysaccharide heptosyltransferase I
VIDGTPRYVIVRLGSLGDVIHAIPAAAALRRRYPDARIDWLVDPRYVAMLKLVVGIDERIAFDPRSRIAETMRTLRRLRRARYDAAIDLQGLLKSATLARAAGARHTIGMTREHLREPMASWLYSQSIDPGSQEHVIHKNLSMLVAVGVDDLRVMFPLNIPRTWPVQAAESRAGDGFALINPGAAWPNKRWPAARFGALAAALRERHALPSLVLWGPGEQSLAEAVVRESRGAAELLPKTTIVDLFGVAQRARLVVSGDTGPLHIAAAVGTPVVALFGPTRAERNGPWSPEDVSVSRFDRCVCHYERRCRLQTPCLEDITVDAVLEAVERRLQAA